MFYEILRSIELLFVRDGWAYSYKHPILSNHRPVVYCLELGQELSRPLIAVKPAKPQHSTHAPTRHTATEVCDLSVQHTLRQHIQIVVHKYPVNTILKYCCSNKTKPSTSARGGRHSTGAGNKRRLISVQQYCCSPYSSHTTEGFNLINTSA